MIAVILLVSGVAIYQGIASYRESRKVTFLAEMEMIQRRVNEVYAEEQLVVSGTGGNADFSAYGQTVSQDVKNRITALTQEEGLQGKEYLEDIITNKIDSFRYFDNTDLVNSLKIEGVNKDREVIINFSTRDVIDIKGVKDADGNIYYRTEDMPGGSRNIDYSLEQGDITFALEEREIDLGRFKITVTNIMYGDKANTGTVYYKMNTDTVWNKTQSNEFIVEEIGNYEVKIVDKSGLESAVQSIDIVVDFTKAFDYTGSVQIFTAPYNAPYKIELWGAQGGTVGTFTGGSGGYTSGKIYLEERRTVLCLCWWNAKL